MSAGSARSSEKKMENQMRSHLADLAEAKDRDMTHTPTPWKVAEHAADKPCVAVADCGPSRDYAAGMQTSCANAALIVRAVNSHEKLVAAAKAARAILEGVAMNCDDNECLKAIENVHDQLTTALAAAKEGA